MNPIPRAPARSPTIPAWLDTRAPAAALAARVWKHWAPPPRMTTTEWANSFRYLSAKGSARPGKYNAALTPWVAFIHEALDDTAIHKVVLMKAAQVGWTDGVVNCFIGKRIDLDPCPMLAMFPTMESAKDYMQEKFLPMIEATPRLSAKVDTSGSRKSGNRGLFKTFAGGFLKLSWSNSISKLKSTPAPVVIIEEPDDASSNVKGQGDAIKLIEERTKTYARRKIIFGGTPSIKDVSAIEDAYRASDQRKFYVPCHECGQDHVLDWSNVQWNESGPEAARHEVYGRAMPETARYVCPHCATPWTDAQKNANVRRLTCRATAQGRGVAGFGHLSELYAPWHESRMQRLVERYLEAKHKADQGDSADEIVFVNSCLGLPYEYAKGSIDEETLKSRAEDYAELVAPMDGLVVTVGVDTQHDRFAITIRAWGPGEESWLLYWGEIYGNTTDRSDLVWIELERSIFGPFRHESGAELWTSAVSIDSGDGNTSENVYHWVRRQHSLGKRFVMPVKGSSDQAAQKEIFSVPSTRTMDYRTPTKASKYGLKVWQVGTNKAKDLILGGREGAGRIRLEGRGPGRIHFYADVRADYYEQITAEVKAPSRRHAGKLVWQLKAGRRNEALDCEVYALHAARSLKLHVMAEDWWNQVRAHLSQPDLFATKNQTVEQHQDGDEATESASVQTSALAELADQRNPAPADNPDRYAPIPWTDGAW
jgi:phage terminase large subunit GpA-like protein